MNCSLDIIKLKKYLLPTVVEIEDLLLIKHYNEIGIIDILISFETEIVIANVSKQHQKFIEAF